MKFMTLAFLFTLTTFVQAADTQNLTCKTTDKDLIEVVGSELLLKDIYGETPEVEIDGSFMRREENFATIALSFSNECDNEFTFILPKNSLEQMQKGKISNIKVFVEYYHADSKGDDDGAFYQTATLRCSFKK